MFLASSLPGQSTSRELRGVVRDEAGVPLENVLVVLDPVGASRRARTDTAGTFSFRRVPAGRHQLQTLRLGYRADDRLVELADSGLSVVIVLQRIATELDTVSVRAPRLGLYGTVIDRDKLRPLGGASVEVMGTRWSGKTLADGQFAFGNLRPGPYLVLVRRPGFRSDMRSVSVPQDAGIELAFILDTVSGNPDKRYEMRWQDFNSRIQWKGRLSAVVPHQELSGHYGQTLAEALKYSRSFLTKGLILVDTLTCVFVDGVPRPGATANDFGADEVEAVEVYGMRSDWTGTLSSTWTRGAPCGAGFQGPGALGPATSSKFGLQPKGVNSSRTRTDTYARAIVIWLKR
jgi:hypothetical protein